MWRGDEGGNRGDVGKGISWVGAKGERGLKGERVDRLDGEEGR